MEEGTILGWRKSEGEQIHRGEILLEIETDKANVEVEATEDGILRKILCPGGATLPIHAPIAILADEAEDVTSAIEAARTELKSMLKDDTALIDALGLGDAVDPSLSGQGRAQGPPVHGAVMEKAEFSSAPQETKASPAARRLARELHVDLNLGLPGTGPGDR